MSSASYNKFFGFVEDPFAGGHNPRFWAPTKALRNSLTRLRAGIEGGTPLILVTGAAGIGKTTLAKSLLAMMGEGARVAEIEDPSLPWEALQESIDTKLRLEAGLLSQESLIAEIRTGHQVVLVLHHAQQTASENLEQFGKLLDLEWQGQRKLLQLVLLADLKDEAPPPNSHFQTWLLAHKFQLHQLSPLDEAETRFYVERRIKVARRGSERTEVFTPAALQEIFTHCQGLPGKINALCNTALELAHRLGQPEIGAALLKQAVFKLENDRKAHASAVREALCEEATQKIDEVDQHQEASSAPASPIPPIAPVAQVIEINRRKKRHGIDGKVKSNTVVVA